MASSWEKGPPEVLGNPKHPGRTRGVEIFAPWKYARNHCLQEKREKKKAKKKAGEDEKLEDFKESSLLQSLRTELLGGGPASPAPAPAAPMIEGL